MSLCARTALGASVAHPRRLGAFRLLSSSGLRAETNEEETVNFTRQATSEKGKVGAEQGAEDTSRAARSACFFSSCDSPRFARFFLFRVFRRVALASFLRVFRRVSHHHHLSLLLVCVEHGLKRGHELETSGVLAFDVLNTRLGRVSLASARHVWSTD